MERVRSDLVRMEPFVLAMFRMLFRILEFRVGTTPNGPSWGFLPLFVAGCAGVLLSITACADRTPGLRVDADESLLRFFAGTWFEPAVVDSMIIESGNELRVDRSLLRGTSALADRWSQVASDGVLDRDEIHGLLEYAYTEGDVFPQTLVDLGLGESFDDGTWFTIEVSGSMTRFRRRLRMPVEAIRSAMTLRSEAGGIHYPPGTMVVGEHTDGGALAEVTVMRRRADGFWDFGAFDALGRRLASIEGDPDRLVIPSDCFGCHYGNKLFEPERSFPGDAAPGPHGERTFYVPDTWRNAVVTRSLDEHRNRADGILAPYATMWVSSLLDRSMTTDLADADRDVLRSMGF